MGELFFCGSINTRILQELVKWFPSTKKKYFPYHYLNFIFNIFWFISVYNALWLLSQAPDLSPPLTPFLHTNPFLRFIFSFCFVTHWVWPGLSGWTQVRNCPLAAVGSPWCGAEDNDFSPRIYEKDENLWVDLWIFLKSCGRWPQMLWLTVAMAVSGSEGSIS